jgi:hypothetical protein
MKNRFAKGFLPLLGALILFLNLGIGPPFGAITSCVYWVAPNGNDGNSGTLLSPWVTLEHAAETIPDHGCTVFFKSGVFYGENRIHRRFEQYAYFKAANPYRTILQYDGPVVSITGARHIVLDGFIFQHSSARAKPLVVQVDRSDAHWSENIILRNNIFRNSYNNDLLKIYNGARSITVTNNLFYNQGASEQHMDVNSVTDVTIQDNIFFNDFASSGHPVENNTKHFIVIKDSNEGEDGQLGSQRILVQRNIFLNWEGAAGETFIKVGNDGKPYFEARDVTVQNNLLLGNTPNPMSAAFGIDGAKNVRFINNTVSGDLPSNAYAMRVNIKNLNPKNENITFCNNIWSDPTGTMGALKPGDKNEFADGDPANTLNLVLDFNLYWNGKKPIPPGDLVSPLKSDKHRLVSDPDLNSDFSDLILPLWQKNSFASQNTTIRQEFVRLVNLYAAVPLSSSAYQTANPTCAPTDDILKRSRGRFPGFGAYQEPRPTTVLPFSSFLVNWLEFLRSLK